MEYQKDLEKFIAVNESRMIFYRFVIDLRANKDIDILNIRV